MKSAARAGSIGVIAAMLLAGCTSSSTFLPGPLPVEPNAGYVTLPISLKLVGSSASAVTATVTASAPNFVSALSTGSCGSGSCTISVSAPPATTSLRIALASAGGSILDTGTALIEADDDANNPPAFCFGCAPATVTLSADPMTLPPGVAGTSTITPLAYDSQGRRIIGSTPFATALALTSSDPSATLTQTTLASPSQMALVSYDGADVPMFAIDGTLAGAIVTPVQISVASATPITLTDGDQIGDLIIPTPEELAAVPTAPPIPPSAPETLASSRRALGTNGVDYTPDFPPVANQGSTNMCAVFAGVYSIYSALQKMKNASNPAWILTGNGLWGNNPQTTFSPRYTYNQRSVNLGRDGGTTLVWVLESLKTIGAIPLADVPWSQKDNPATSYLTQANLDLSSNYRISAYYSVPTLAGIKNYLNAGYPIYIGMLVDRGLANLTATEPIYSGYNGSSKGGHAMVIVGYDNTVAGGSFIVLNSWGQSFGRNGFFYLPFSFWTNGARSIQAMVEEP